MGLHLTKSEFDMITKFFKDMKNDQVEIEAKIRPVQFETATSSNLPKTYSGSDFVRLTSYLDKVTDYSRLDVPEQLDIMIKSVDNIRTSISGLDNIVSFCKQCEPTPNTTILEKSKEHVVKIPEHGVTVQYSTETPIRSSMKTYFDMIKNSNVIFRLKKRISYTHNTSGFRIDCTIVKQTPNWVKSNTVSQISSIRPVYEIEIEYVGGSKKAKQSHEELPYVFLDTIAEVCKVLEDVDILLPLSNRLSVLSEYHSLVFDKNLDLKLLATNPKRLFAGPQPVSMELKHLLPKEDVATSVLQDYTLTHKADGERALVFVDSEGDVYFLNNRMDLKKTGISAKTFKSSLFDAEIIQNVATGDLHVHLFDAYFSKNQNTTSYHLEGERSRMTFAREFASKCTKQKVQNNVHIYTKKYLVANNPKEFFTHVKTLLAEQRDNKTNVFNTDGIILTPLSLTVGTDLPNQRLPKLFGTWEKVLKWKPPELNTIDVLVRSEVDHVTRRPRVVAHNVHGPCIKYTLHVPHKANTTPYTYFTLKYSSSDGIMSDFRFQPDPENADSGICYVPIDASGFTLCENRERIESDCIVEMAWKQNQWVPLKVRHDKTSLYKTYNVNAANSYFVAMKIWFTILNPVERNHINGTFPVTKEIVTVDPNATLYYDNKGERKESYLYKMNEFHNKFVKNRHLINRFGKGKESLFDIGCGRGGDLDKWITAGITKVLGIDLYRDNIVNESTGAYSRLISNFKFDRRRQTYVFLNMDASKRIDDDAIKTISDSKDRLVASIVWGIEKTANADLKKLQNLATKKFDLVSSQFAMHYFFKDETMLDNVCYNISNHLNQGGLFISTFFDGEAVNNILQSVEKDDVLKSHPDKGLEGQAWYIRKKYDRYKQRTFGQAIGVYIQTIGHEIEEYLLDYNLLVERLQMYGIRPLTKDELSAYNVNEGRKLEQSTGMFSQLFNDMTLQRHDYGDSLPPHLRYMDECINMSVPEQTISFLNRWAVFIKAGRIDVAQQPVVLKTSRRKKV